MDTNNVYELAKTLQQTEGLEKDFLEMVASLKETIEKNYIQKIQLAAGHEKSMSVEHPPKEVTLLRALSPFLDENGQGQLSRLTHSMLLMRSLQNIQENVAGISADGALLAARSADGPAESPSPQAARMAGLLLTLALTEKF